MPSEKANVNRDAHLIHVTERNTDLLYDIEPFIKLKINHSTLGDGKVLTYDETSNTLVYRTVAGGSGSPGGTDKQIQFNNEGVLGGNESFTFDKDLESLAVGTGSIVTGGSSVAEGFEVEVTGQYSHGSGSQNQVSGNASEASGGGNVVTSDYSSVEGRENQATSECSHAEGYGSITTLPCQHAFASGPFTLGVCGEAQGSRLVAKNITTDTTQFNLLVNNSPINIRPNTTVGFTIYITARNMDNGTVGAYFVRNGLISNNANTVALIGTVGIVGSDINSSGLAIDITADNFNKALKIRVTGLDSTTIRWVAIINFVEVG